MKKLILSILFLAACWAPSPAAAEIMTYQGRLKETGIPVTGNRSLGFDLCDDEAAGTCYPSPDGDQPFAVTNGLFRSTFTIPSVNLSGAQWYLRVSVESSPLTPRERLTFVPYSVFSSSAASAAALHAYSGDGVVASSNVIVSGNITAGDWGAVYSTYSAITGMGKLQNLAPGSEDVRVGVSGRVISDSTEGLDVLVGGNFEVEVPATKGGMMIGVRAAGRNDESTPQYVGVYVDTLENSGIVGNTYGVYISTLTAGIQTNQPYAVYSEDANARTYFAGKVGISSAAPAYALSVSSAAGETGTIMAVSTGSTNVFWVAGDGAHALKFVGDGSGLTGVTGASGTDSTKVLKTGDTMTGQLTLDGSTLTVTGNAFSVGKSTLVVTGGHVGINWVNPTVPLYVNYLAGDSDVAQFGSNGIVISTGGAIRTTGTGNGSVSGDPRGMGAVDLQTSRSVASQVAGAPFSTISGGNQNTASVHAATVGGGQQNIASSFYTVVGGGYGNKAQGHTSVVAGGDLNTASGQVAAVGGGANNVAVQDYSAISGGRYNAATSSNSAIGGGIYNTVTGTSAVVAGGENNLAGGMYSAVAGGGNNSASNLYTSVSGGLGNTASAQYSAVSGGQSNTANNNHAYVGGGFGNTAGYSYATVPGGESNTANQTHATVSGGQQNTASGQYSAIAGGSYNTASASLAAILGGDNNRADGMISAVAGGTMNRAGGYASMVSGGYGNVADGSYSWAGGYKSSSTESGSFTWSDSEGTVLANSTPDRTVFKNRGGFIVTGSTSTSMGGSIDRGVMITGNGLVGVSINFPEAAVDVVSTGTLQDQYAQIWRNGVGAIVGSMSAAGYMQAVRFVGDGSGLTGVSGTDSNALPLTGGTMTGPIDLGGNYITSVTTIAVQDGYVAIVPKDTGGNNSGYGISIGSNAYNSYDSGIGIGFGAYSNHTQGVGIGAGALNNAYSGVGMGQNAANNYTYGVGVGMAAENNFAYGVGVGANSSANNNFGVGVGANAIGNAGHSVGVGAFSAGNGSFGAALGAYSYANSSGTALGANARATAPNSVAIGNGTVNNSTGTASFGGYGIFTSTAVSAGYYQIDGSTVLAVLPAPSSIAVGPLAGASNTTGAYNVFVGRGAGSSNTSATNNTMLGYGAGTLNTGAANTFLGSYAGNLSTAGGSNIVIGYLQDTSDPAASNELNIGGVIFGTLGNKSIGISTRAPQAALDIVATSDNAADSAQIWRNQSGVVKASVTATGVFYGDGSGLTGVTGATGTDPNALPLAGGTMTGQLTMSGSSLTMRTGSTVNFAADSLGHVGINAFPDSAAGLLISGTGTYEAGLKLQNAGSIWAVYNSGGNVTFTKVDGATAVRMVLTPSGRLGLATASPADTLHVVGGVTATTMTVSGDTFTVGASTLVVTNGSVGVNWTTPEAALQVSGGAKLLGNSTTGYALSAGTFARPDLLYVSTGGFVRVGDFSAQSASTDTVLAVANVLRTGGSAAVGVEARAHTDPGATVNAYGDGVVAAGNFEAAAGLDDWLMNLVGLRTQVRVENPGAGGQVNRAVSLWVDQPYSDSAGAILENTYGIFIASQTSIYPGVHVAAPYAIYSEGSNSIAYFAGNVGISSAVPTAALVISSAAGSSDPMLLVSTGASVVFGVKGNGEVFGGKFIGDGSALTGVFTSAGGTMNGPMDMNGNFLSGVSTITMYGGSIAIVPVGTGGSNESYGISIGSNTYHNYSYGVGIGYGAYDNQNSGVGIGRGAYSNTNGVGIGYNARGNNGYGVGIGVDANVNVTGGVGVGWGAYGNSNYGVGIGAQSQLNKNYASALGAYSFATTSATALGSYAKANAYASIAIGAGTVNNSTGTASFGGYGIVTSTAVNAGYYQVNGSTVLAVSGTSDTALALGMGAGRVNTGMYNLFAGYSTGFNNTGGQGNTFLGSYAGSYNNAGGNNTFLGMEAGNYNNTGEWNLVAGSGAGYYSQTGSANTLLGGRAGGYISAAVNSFSSSTAVGYHAGYNLSAGADKNTLIGYEAGYQITTGTGNIIIGVSVDPSQPTDSNVLNIGDLVFGTLDEGGVGINSFLPPVDVKPAAALDVVSTGTTVNQYAQIWRDSNGIAVASITATGRFTTMATMPGDDLGDHNAIMDLYMGGNNIYQVSTMTASGHVSAAAYQINGSTVLALLPGTGSIGVGESAGKVNAGMSNSFFGGYAGLSNTAGVSNTFIGSSAGRSNTTANYNSFVGSGAGYGTTTGGENSFLGYGAGQSNTTGASNTFIGKAAGLLTKTGSANTVVGRDAGYGVLNNSFSSSTIVGFQAGFALEGGADNNVLLGYQAGYDISTGTGNIVIGNHLNLINPTDSNTLNIGDVIYGSLATGQLGMGTRTPIARLDVQETDYLNANYSLRVSTSPTSYHLLVTTGGWIGINQQDPKARVHMGGGSGDEGILIEHTSDLAADQAGGFLAMLRARGTYGGTQNLVADNDPLGAVAFFGYDNGPTDPYREAAYIWGKVDGTPSVGGSDMPGRLEFWTTPDGSGTSLNRMVIKNTGNVGISTGNPVARLEVVAASMAPAEMAQIWRDSGGNIVSSVSATGSLEAVRFVGDGSGLTNVSATTFSGTLTDPQVSISTGAFFGGFNAAEKLVQLDGSGDLSLGGSLYVSGNTQVGSQLKTAAASFHFYDANNFDRLLLDSGRTAVYDEANADILSLRSGMAGINVAVPQYALDVSTYTSTEEYVARLGANAIVISTGGAVQTTGLGYNNVQGNARGQGSVDLQTYRTNPGEITASVYSTIAGGQANSIDVTADISFIGAGVNNRVVSSASFVGGGVSNVAQFEAPESVVVGGESNQTEAAYAAVVGGTGNISGDAGNGGIAAFIGGGANNEVHHNYGAITGGMNNIIGTAADYGFIGGGASNGVNGVHAAIAGGWNNHADGMEAFIGAGMNINAFGEKSFIGGGSFHTVDARYGAVAGGTDNKIQGFAEAAFIGGGQGNISTGAYSTIGGGFTNVSSGAYSGVLTGYHNVASSHTAVVVGGEGNVAMGDNAFVGGGYWNTAGEMNAVVGGGIFNKTFAMNSAVVGGESNIVFDTGWRSSIGGGQFNTIRGQVSAIGGGAYNSVNQEANYAFIGGGYYNVSTGVYSTVGGGFSNTSSGTYSAVLGGYGNVVADGDGGAIVGGRTNMIDGYSYHAFIGGGQDNHITSGMNAVIGGGLMNSADMPEGFVGGGYSNQAAKMRSIVVGGAFNSSTGDYGIVGGGEQNVSSGAHSGVFSGYMNVSSGSYSGILGGYNGRIESLADYAVIAGGRNNLVWSEGAVVSGGEDNTVLGMGSVIAGGLSNQTTQPYAVIGGGYINKVTNLAGTVAGGYGNMATGSEATVGGGQYNHAEGNYATIPGGQYNSAMGQYSFAAGYYSSSTAMGTFTWADSEGVLIENNLIDQVMFKNRGGFWVSTGTVYTDPAIFVDAQNRVGVGTTSQFGKLHVMARTGNSIAANTASGSGTDASIYGYASTAATAIKGVANGTSYAGRFEGKVLVTDSGTNPASPARLQVNGDLGVGSGLDNTSNAPIVIWLTSINPVNSGDVVVSATNNQFDRTTTASNTAVIGVVVQALGASTLGKVAVGGVVPVNCISGTGGQHAVTSGTAGAVQGTASPTSGASIGVFLEGCGATTAGQAFVLLK